MMTELEFEELTLAAKLAGYELIWERPIEDPGFYKYESHGWLMVIRRLGHHAIVYAQRRGDAPLMFYKGLLANVVAGKFDPPEGAR